MNRGEDKYINCGMRKVQKGKRVALSDIFSAFGIEEGDYVEVYINPCIKKSVLEKDRQ